MVILSVNSNSKCSIQLFSSNRNGRVFVCSTNLYQADPCAYHLASLQLHVYSLSSENTISPLFRHNDSRRVWQYAVSELIRHLKTTWSIWKRSELEYIDGTATRGCQRGSNYGTAPGWSSDEISVTSHCPTLHSVNASCFYLFTPDSDSLCITNILQILLKEISSIYSSVRRPSSISSFLTLLLQLNIQECTLFIQNLTTTLWENIIFLFFPGSFPHRNGHHHEDW